MLPACRVTSLAFVAPFWVWVLLRSPRRAAVIVGASLIAAAPWSAYYLAIYGGPFGPSTRHLSGSRWSADVAVPLAGILVSPGRGLLVYQPWLILAPLAFVPAIRSGGARRPAQGDQSAGSLFRAGAVVLLVGLISAWTEWWGGFCWGSRLVVEIVPLGASCRLAGRRVAPVGGGAGRGPDIGVAGRVGPRPQPLPRRVPLERGLRPFAPGGGLVVGRARRSSPRSTCRAVDGRRWPGRAEGALKWV